MNFTANLRLLRLADANRSADGNAIGFRVQRHDNASLEVWCPRDEAADIIQFLCALVAGASELSGSQSPHPSQQTHLAPMPIQGLGFAAGRDPSLTNLVVHLPGISLAFEMASSALIALADEMSRIARTLSASPRTAQ